MSITFPRFTERTFDVILRGSAGEQGEGDQELAHEEVGKEKEPATNPQGITRPNGTEQPRLLRRSPRREKCLLFV